jgi:hypothetical protein
MACAAHRDPCTTNAFIGDYFGLAISEENVYALFVSTHCPSDVIGDDGGPVYYQQQVLATVARSDLGSPRLATDLVTRSVTIPGRRPHTAGLRFPKRWRSVSTQWLCRSALGVFGCRRRDKDGAEQIVVESAERGACAAQSRIEGGSSSRRIVSSVITRPTCQWDGDHLRSVRPCMNPYHPGIMRVPCAAYLAW